LTSLGMLGEAIDKAFALVEPKSKSTVHPSPSLSTQALHTD